MSEESIPNDPMLRLMTLPGQVGNTSIAPSPKGLPNATDLYRENRKRLAILRAASQAALNNPIVNPVVVSGAGYVTVSQAASIPANVADIGSLGPMVTAGTLPIRCFGGNPQVPFGSTVRIQLPKNPVAGTGYSQGTYNFAFDGSTIAITLDTGGSGSFRVIADGQYVGTGGVPTLYNTFAGVVCIITFATSTTHFVSIERASNGAVTAIAKEPASQIWRPEAAQVKALVLGDSYSQGTGASFEQNSWISQAALRLGWDVIVQAQGGTGYVNPSGTNGFSKFGSTDRLAYVNAQAYDVIVLAGGINDAQVPYNTTVKTECLALLKAVRALQPDSLIIVFGAWSGTTGPSTGTVSVTQTELDIQAAVSSFNDPLCFFIPVSTTVLNNRPWLLGTGNTLIFNAPLNAATSGTLVANFPGPTGLYEIRFSDGSIRSGVTLTGGSAAVSWSGAVTASADASAYSAGSPGNTEKYITNLDRTHPNDAGHAYLGLRAQKAIIGILEN